MTGAPLPYPDEQAQAGPPPDLLAMLGGGMAPPMGDPMAGGPPPGPPPGPEPPSDPAGILKQMLDLSKAYMDVEQDDEDKAAIASILSKIQTLFAKQQREADAALGVSGPQKFMRRQAVNG